jgi:hypothetical protein
MQYELHKGGTENMEGRKAEFTICLSTSHHITTTMHVIKKFQSPGNKEKTLTALDRQEGDIRNWNFIRLKQH